MASVSDDYVELVLEDIDAALVDRQGVIVITPTETAVRLTCDDVRALVEACRRYVEHPVVANRVGGPAGR